MTTRSPNSKQSARRAPTNRIPQVAEAVPRGDPGRLFCRVALLRSMSPNREDLLEYHGMICEFINKWKETPQYCGRFPARVSLLQYACHPLRERHYGRAKSLFGGSGAHFSLRGIIPGDCREQTVGYREDYKAPNRLKTAFAGPAAKTGFRNGTSSLRQGNGQYARSCFKEFLACANFDVRSPFFPRHTQLFLTKSV